MRISSASSSSSRVSRSRLRWKRWMTPVCGPPPRTLWSGTAYAGEEPEDARVDAVEHHRLGRAVVDEDGHVGEPLEDLVGKLAQRLLGDLLEALVRHARRVGLGGGVETQHGEPLARRALVVAALVERGAEQPARVGLLLDGESAAPEDVLQDLDRALGLAEVLEVDLGRGDGRRRVVRVDRRPSAGRPRGRPRGRRRRAAARPRGRGRRGRRGRSRGAARGSRPASSSSSSSTAAHAWSRAASMRDCARRLDLSSLTVSRLYP